jgi:hypothetical protein
MCFKFKAFKNIGATLIALLLLCFCTFLMTHSQDIDGLSAFAAEEPKGIGESAVEALIEALKDENDKVRMQAATALGEIRSPHAIGPLIAALKDKNSDVRKMAASALGKIGNPAVQPLIAVLQKHENPNVREMAAGALGMIKDPRSVRPLMGALKDDNSDVRSEAAAALGKIKGLCAVEPLKRLGSIVVKSTPHGALVFLDGKRQRDITPTVIEKVPVGEKHEIRVEKEGFKPWAKTVEPEADKCLRIHVTLAKLVNTKKYKGAEQNWFTMWPIEMPKEPATICTISIEPTEPGKLYIGQKDGGVSIAVFKDEGLGDLWRTYSCFGPGGCYIDGWLNKWLIKVPVHSWIVVYFDEAGRTISRQKILGAIITDGLTEGDSYAPESPIQILCNQGETIVVPIAPFGDDYLWEPVVVPATEPNIVPNMLPEMLPPEPKALTSTAKN